ncbi:hypothetical protein GQ472_06375 [archaeon]|nr:hypothetical protein [archaeon]
MGQYVKLNLHSKDFHDFLLNLKRAYSREELEQIMQSKPLSKKDVDLILERNIRYVTFEDNGADGIIRGRYYDLKNNDFVYDVAFKEISSLDEYAITGVHEFLHIFYKFTSYFLDEKSDKIADELIENEAVLIFNERPGLAKYIFNSCLFRAVEPDVY